MAEMDGVGELITAWLAITVYNKVLETDHISVKMVGVGKTKIVEFPIPKEKYQIEHERKRSFLHRFSRKKLIYEESV
jgi:hypothetical protein